MKKFRMFILIFLLINIFGQVSAYNINNTDTQIINNATKKIEAIVQSKGELYREKIINLLNNYLLQRKNNQRLQAVITKTIENIIKSGTGLIIKTPVTVSNSKAKTENNDVLNSKKSDVKETKAITIDKESIKKYFKAYYPNDKKYTFNYYVGYTAPISMNNLTEINSNLSKNINYYKNMILVDASVEPTYTGKYDYFRFADNKNFELVKENMPLESIKVISNSTTSADNVAFSKESDGDYVYLLKSGEPINIDGNYTSQVNFDTKNSIIVKHTVRGQYVIYNDFEKIKFGDLYKYTAGNLGILNQIKNKTDELISGTSNNDEKILAIYKWITTNIKVDPETLSEHAKGNYGFNPTNYDVSNGIGTYKNKYGICSGFAGLFYYMLSFAGINNSEMISGDMFTKNGSQSHVWNKIGEYYYDTMMDLGADNNNYKYYKLSADKMNINHRPTN